MAAVSDGSGKSLEEVDCDLKRHLTGVNTRTPDLSTLAQKGDEKLVEQFMTEDVQIGGGANEKLQSQLYIACFWGFYDVVKGLLDKGADVNAQNKDTLWTPLHAATFQEHGKIVMLLLERNAQPELQDSEGRSAKDFASASDKVWSHFAALNCPRTSKQELIKKGIIKKLEESSRAGSSGRPGSGPKARMAAFSRPGSAYVLQSDPFAKRQVNQQSSDFPLGGPVDGDILAGTNKRGQVEHVSKPAFSVWRT
ncbi:protein phosphatase 1 regulatory subunit 16A-like [Stylophora pistillata]|uniref:Homeobox protein Wariai n=1 Tax=Stylophora pistillata TaxID=50429 RepID=A0A2B4SKP0_STYPI|nr:protein phosphatase 1 regulatory subunit 16A-like [Stylophora pistillata]PFX30451.1 Homeobox protein Wariai [Stylophora pistillata]